MYYLAEIKFVFHCILYFCRMSVLIGRTIFFTCEKKSYERFDWLTFSYPKMQHLFAGWCEHGVVELLASI